MTSRAAYLLMQGDSNIRIRRPSWPEGQYLKRRLNNIAVYRDYRLSSPLHSLSTDEDNADDWETVDLPEGISDIPSPPGTFEELSNHVLKQWLITHSGPHTSGSLLTPLGSVVDDCRVMSYAEQNRERIIVKMQSEYGTTASIPVEMLDGF